MFFPQTHREWEIQERPADVGPEKVSPHIYFFPDTGKLRGGGLVLGGFGGGGGADSVGAYMGFLPELQTRGVGFLGGGRGGE